MSVEENNKLEETASSSQPDNLFKLVTSLQAQELGLQTLQTELQHVTTRVDLVLAVPPDITLEGTMFDFFRAVNVVEFKSQNDLLTLEQYVKNDLRTDLQFLWLKAKSYDAILNVIISSRLPRDFLDYVTSQGVIFKPDSEKPWLWRGQVGFQNVAIVVCRLLPIEERYYHWLVFSPTTSQKWRTFMEKVWSERNRPILELVERIRPKEYTMITKEFQEKLREALKQPQYNQPYEEPPELPAILLLEEIEQDMPEILEKVLSVLPPERRLVGLTSEQREKLLAGLEPQERLAGLELQERLAGLEPQEREKLLKLLLEQTKTSSQ